MADAAFALDCSTVGQRLKVIGAGVTAGRHPSGRTSALSIAERCAPPAGAAPSPRAALAVLAATAAISSLRRRHGSQRFRRAAAGGDDGFSAAAPWDSFFPSSESAPEPEPDTAPADKLPSTTKEIMDALKNSMQIMVKSGFSRVDVDLPAGLRLGLESGSNMDPFILSEDVPKEQVTLADRELARLFLAMFKVMKKRMTIAFRTPGQASAAKKAWGKAVGHARVVGIGKGSKKGAFGSQDPGANFIRSVKEVGDGFVVVVAPRAEQLLTIAKAAEEVGDKTCLILLNARLRGLQRGDPLREELASIFNPAFHVRLVGSRGQGLVYRTLKDGLMDGFMGSPWVLAERSLPSTLAQEVSQSGEEPTADEIRAAFPE